MVNRSHRTIDNSRLSVKIIIYPFHELDSNQRFILQKDAPYPLGYLEKVEPIVSRHDDR